MKKSQFLVTMAATSAALGSSVPKSAQAQNPIRIPNGPIGEATLNPNLDLSRGVIEAPPSRFNPRLELSASNVKPDFKIDPSLLANIGVNKLMKDFADDLESRLKGKAVGYAFVVRFRDSNTIQARAGGVARRAPDASPRPMTVDERFNIASVSKTITAAALLKLMAQQNKSIDMPARQLLPPDWTIGPNFNTVTVRELLTHKSGVRFPGEVTMANLRAGVAAGIKMSDKPIYQYNNSNFGLMRFMVARLENPGVAPIPAAAPAVYGNTYMVAVRKQVFDPIGLSGIECKPFGTLPAQCYQFPSPVVAGTDFGDMSETNASRGWNMSARQLSTFGGKLFFSGQIMPQPQVETMIKDNLGVYGGQLTPAVAEFGHNGYYPGKGENNQLYNAGELNSVLLGFSNGVSVALLVNSQLGPGQSPTGAAKQAMKVALAKN